jgi:hypothetical protein
MAAEAPTESGGWHLWVRWVLGTALGAVVGVIAAIVLSYLVVNLFYPRETNLIVSGCLGTGIAWLQRVAVRPRATLATRWIFGGAVVMAPPSILAVVADEWALDVTAGTVQLVFFAIVLTGGLVGALLQASALQPHTRRANWWVGASAASWTLAANVSSSAGVLGAGVVLATVSGAFFVWLMRAPAVMADA